MSTSTLELARRRQALQQRCAEQRRQLVQTAGAIEARLRNIDRGVLAIRRSRLGPMLLTLLGATLAAAPMLRSASRALRVIGTVRRLLSGR